MARGLEMLAQLATLHSVEQELHYIMVLFFVLFRLVFADVTVLLNIQ